MLQEIKVNAEVLKLCQESITGNDLDLDFQRLKKERFSRCKNISLV